MTTYPDYAAADLTPERFRQAIEQFGCLLIRKAVSPPMLSEMLERTKDIYAFADQEFAAGRMPQHFNMGLYRFGHIHACLLDRPGEAAYSLVRDTLRGSVLTPLLHKFYGPKVTFLVNHCHPRRQRIADFRQKLPFHQDAIFMGDKFLSLNCWTPLSDCGVDAPGLEVVMDGSQTVHTPKLVGSAAHHPYDQLELEYPWVVETFGEERLWRPVMELGDVLVFTNFTIHRTAYTDHMNRERVSFELRCAAPDTLVLPPGMPLLTMQEGKEEFVYSESA